MEVQNYSPRVLVVEDEKIVAMDIKRRIESFQYTVLGITDSGEKAIELAAKLHPDIIIMDIILSGDMDGIEAASIIGKNYDIPFIFLTASSDDVSLQRAKLSGPHGYIIKPFEARDLKSALDIALHNSTVERKLKESELWLQATLTSIRDAVITTDMQQRIMFMNPAAESFFGLSEEEYKDVAIHEVYKVEPDTTNESLIAHFSSADKVDIVRARILKNNAGEQFYIEESVSLIKDRYHKEHGFVYTFRDITQRRKAELQVLASRDFYLSLFEDFPTPVWRSNAEGEFNYFNNTWLKFTGRNLENEIFQGWTESIKETDRQRFLDTFAYALRNKSRFEIEFELLSRDGVYRWVICIGTPLFALEGEFKGFIGACIDISHMITAQNELIRAKNAAESANLAKVRFLSNMSHEVRTPLNGIIGILSLLNDTKLDGSQAEYVNMAQMAAHTLLGLLNNLLDISKIESKRDTASYTEENLHAVVSEILLPFEYQAKIKRVRLLKEFSFAEDLKVHVDKNKLQQIIGNLLSNAVKFTDYGEVAVQLSYEKNNHQLRTDVIHLVVKDSGIGIAPENHALIFESFVQVDNSNTRKFNGAGLGLAIVKNITEALGGSIWLNSELGKGSEFHVVIPVMKNKTNRNKANKMQGEILL